MFQMFRYIILERQPLPTAVSELWVTSTVRSSSDNPKNMRIGPLRDGDVQHGPTPRSPQLNSHSHWSTPCLFRRNPAPAPNLRNIEVQEAMIALLELLVAIGCEPLSTVPLAMIVGLLLLVVR